MLALDHKLKVVFAPFTVNLQTPTVKHVGLMDGRSTTTLQIFLLPKINVTSVDYVEPQDA